MLLDTGVTICMDGSYGLNILRSAVKVILFASRATSRSSIVVFYR